LVNVDTVLIADAHPVGITIHDKEDVCSDFDRALEGNVDVGFNWLRSLHLGEDGVAFRVYLDDGVVAAAEEPREPSRTVTPHWLHKDLQSCVAQLVQIDEFAEMFDVGGIWIPSRYQSLCLSIRDFDAFYILDGWNCSFDFLQPIRRYGAAEGVAYFEAVVRRRIVAGGDVDCAAGLALDDAVADNRGGGVVVRQPHVDAVACHHFGGGSGKQVA
jgi:hypothetical protein